MIRAVLTIITVVAALVFMGCADERHKHDAEADTKEAKTRDEAKNQALTGDEAKQALLAMDVRQIPPGVFVPPPKDEPINTVNPNETSFGIYHCNLKEKTFHASAYYPNADLHKHNEVLGVFEVNADGKWVAKVTESSSGG